MRLHRTYLFAPGNHPRKVAKVFGAGADAVVLDLEDAVAVAEKEATRAVVVEALQAPRACLGYVRVNGLDTDYCHGDLQAVVAPGVDGVMLPKVEAPGQLETVDWLIGQLERERGLPQGSVDLLPIIETGRGVAAAEAIAGAGTRVRRLSFGAGDYTRDMGMVWTGAEAELAHARACIVLASRVGGLEPPIDTVFIDLSDEENLEHSARTAVSFGFQGKLCIHPKQVEPVNRVFSPSVKAVAQAQKHVAAFREAEAAGSASIQVDGYFIDYPIFEKAERILRIAEAIRGKDSRAV